MLPRSFDIRTYGRQRIVEMTLRQSRINPDPERPVHDEIAVVERSGHPVVAVLHVGLAQQVAAEQKVSPDLFSRR